MDKIFQVGQPIYPGLITDVRGVKAGHHTLTSRPTGCSVVLTCEGAVGGVDVRGAAPGTRETDLLDPSNLVEIVHAVLLSGGSAWGLDAAGGVMHWLETHGFGLAVGNAPGQIVPIVPAAVLFDLHIGNAQIRPGADAGFAAAQAAIQTHSPLMQGNVGAGAGATVGKLFGMTRAMKGGIGSASLSLNNVTVGALVAVNALGNVRDPVSGQLLAGVRAYDNDQVLVDDWRTLLEDAPQHSLLAGRNTTIGVIATDAKLTKSQVRRLAMAGHDGLARAIAPVHTMSDGDTLFALATGQADSSTAPNLTALSHLAALVVAYACANAVWLASSLTTQTQVFPAAQDLVEMP